MIFTPTALAGAWLIEPEQAFDERGSFARTWCRQEFENRGLVPAIEQCNLSFNRRKGTLRGLHWQKSPFGECKLVRCTQGAIFDVIVDLRAESSTYRQWIAFELSAENKKALYIPEDFAHGFQTLADNTEVFYQMSKAYHAPSAAGARWDDSAFGICWPTEATRHLSPRDASFPDYQQLTYV